MSLGCLLWGRLLALFLTFIILFFVCMTSIWSNPHCRNIQKVGFSQETPRETPLVRDTSAPWLCTCCLLHGKWGGEKELPWAPSDPRLTPQEEGLQEV